jgi:putative toxin-antitoxin system antitoxin component (TIGR02293 family)
MPAFIQEGGGSSKGLQKARSSKSKAVRKGENAMVLLDMANKPEYLLSPFEKITMVRQGISKNALEHFKRKTGLDYDQLSAILLVARATFINKKGNAKFNQTLSEKILGLADIYSYGYEVFGDQNRFNEWIFRPNRSLSGHSPYDLLDNQYGREEVRNSIGRIDFGVYS